jgi:predicted ABC-type ATPase
LKKRIRVIAGPNGSGKSSYIHKVLAAQGVNLGIYVNADDIELALKINGRFSFSMFGLNLSKATILTEFSTSTFLTRLDKTAFFDAIEVTDNQISIIQNSINSYVAAMIADIARQYLLRAEQSFTFETVMSDKSKLEFLQKAKSQGFRIYLYFVTTETPLINIARVKNRVETGGHNVSEDKIQQRYYRTMNLLFDAVTISDRAFLFDNSNDFTFVAAIENGEQVTIEVEDDQIPNWFIDYIEEKVNTNQ